MTTNNNSLPERTLKILNDSSSEPTYKINNIKKQTNKIRSLLVITDGKAMANNN